MKLFQISNPPVRYWLLTDVMEKDEDDPLLLQARKDCAKFHPRVRLLSTLRDDGTWPISKQRKLAENSGPGQPVGWTYPTIIRNLYALLQYNTPTSERRVRNALEKVFSWQAEEGFIPGPWTKAFPIPHWNGYTLHVLLRCGLEEDPRTQKLISWLLSMQRTDGGWNMPYLEDVRYLPEYRHMRVGKFMELMGTIDKSQFDLKKFDRVPSSIWATVQVVWGLVESPKWIRSQQVKRGAEFFLNRFFKRNYHATFYQSENNWTRLKYPPYFGSGLSALDILTKSGYGPDDERMERPIRWLLSAKSNDGLWYQSERPNPEKDQWITVIALRVLKRYRDRY